MGRREVRQRLRSRAFVATTIIGVVFAAVAVAAGLVGGTRPPAHFAVASSDQRGDLVLVAAHVQAPAFGVRLSVGRVTARAAFDGVTSGSLDAAVVGGRIVIARPSRSRAARLVGLLQSASQRVAAVLALSHPPFTPARRSAALTLRPLRLRVLERSSSAPDAVGIAVPGQVLILVMYCSFITAGVVEEKSTRVVEVVLGAVSPRSLLAGKVSGLAALALGQVVLLELVGAAAAVLIGVHISHAAALDLLLVPAGLLLGFAFYGCLYAAAGAMASPSGDSRAFQLPLNLLLLVGMLVAEKQASHLSSSVVQVLSLLPPFAPVLLPARLSAGAIGPIALIVGLVLTIGSAILLVRLAARAYAASILRLGGRAGLREALRSSA